jgi:glucokinase
MTVSAWVFWDGKTPSFRQELQIAYRLGIDLGGTKVALAVAEVSRGQITRLIALRQRPTAATRNPRADVARIVRDARELIAQAGLSTDPIEAVGLSVPGPIDRSTGTLHDPPNLPGWQRVPIRNWVADAFGCMVSIDNDANAAALAEWQYGAGQGARDLVFLTMSTGVGAGLVVDGRLVRGHSGNAGEFGHIPVESDGERCRCGLRGCLEAYVGGAAWTERLRAQCPANSDAAQRAGGSSRVTPEHVVEAARNGDAYALSELERFNGYLARGIANIAFALAPERVILGTIPTAAGDGLCFAPVRDLVRSRIWPQLDRGLKILPAALGAELPGYAGVCVTLSTASG